MTAEQLSKFTKNQKSILALLANACLRKYSFENTPDHEKSLTRLRAKDYEQGMIYSEVQTAAHACRLLAIPFEIIEEIRHGKVTGIQNLNRLASFQTFETDYPFKY